MNVTGRIQGAIAKSVLASYAAFLGLGLVLGGLMYVVTRFVGAGLGAFPFDAVRSEGLGPLPLLRQDGAVEAVLVQGRSDRYESGTQTLELWLDGGPHGTMSRHFPEFVLARDWEFTHAAVVALSEMERPGGVVGLQAWLVANSRRAGPVLLRLPLEPDARPRVVAALPIEAAHDLEWEFVRQVVALDLGPGRAEICVDLAAFFGRREWLRFSLEAEGDAWRAGPVRVEAQPGPQQLDLISLPPGLPKEFWHFSAANGGLTATRISAGQAAEQVDCTEPITITPAGATLRAVTAGDPLFDQALADLAALTRAPPEAEPDASPPTAPESASPSTPPSTPNATQGRAHRSPPPQPTPESALVLEFPDPNEPPLVVLLGRQSARTLTPNHVLHEVRYGAEQDSTRHLETAIFLDPIAETAHQWRWLAPLWLEHSKPRPWYAWRDLLLPR